MQLVKMLSVVLLYIYDYDVSLLAHALQSLRSLLHAAITAAISSKKTKSCFFLEFGPAVCIWTVLNSDTCFGFFPKSNLLKANNQDATEVQTFSFNSRGSTKVKP